MRQTTLACALVVFVSGCPDIKTDPGEGPGEIVNGPTVEFDPGAKIVPFPNNLLLDPATGKVNLPAQCNEGPAQTGLRTQVLNKLDGFGTFEVGIQATFSTPVDAASLTDHVLLFQRAKNGMPVLASAAQPTMVKLIPGKTVRFDAACTTPSMIDAVTIVPVNVVGVPVPLDEKSTYTVVLLKGIKTADGKDFEPSFTWALVRQSVDPVMLDASGNVISERTPLDPNGDANGNGVPDLTELRGLDLLWKAHAGALAFLDKVGHSDRSTILLAWDFNTQTTTDPLDPTVASSPAAMEGTTPLLQTNSLTCSFDATTCPLGYNRTASPFTSCPGGDNNTQCFLKILIGNAACAGACTSAAQIYGTGDAVCTQVGCAAIGDIMVAGLIAPNYQTAGMNPLAGGAPVPGPWSDPVHPMQAGMSALQVLIFVPATAGPYPTVVFGHGLTSSKTSLFAIAPQLAAAGFASVAIDFVNHGSRAVRTSNDAALGCSGSPSPTGSPQCFASIITTDLAATRDNFRQTVLDQLRLINALKACGATGCQSANSAGNLKVDVNHIVYAGISLGGIIGSTLTAVSPDIKASVLNVAAVGLLEILENTQSKAIQCQLVNGLIDAGVVTGPKFDPAMPTVGLCLTDAWKTQPGYQQFAGIARWVLDPADGANFTPKLATRKLLLQEVVDDKVVPNAATDIEGALLGLAPMMADPFIPGSSASAAVTTMPMMNKWVRYLNLGPAAPSFPGNTFQHASLLSPTSGNDGRLGTARLQTDAITFLSINK